MQFEIKNIAVTSLVSLPRQPDDGFFTERTQTRFFSATYFHFRLLYNIFDKEMEGKEGKTEEEAEGKPKSLKEKF